MRRIHPVDLDLFVRTALALREQSDDTHRSEQELFNATCAFLDHARVRHGAYVKDWPVAWFELAFIPPLLALPGAARRITGERTDGRALAALEKFLTPDGMRVCRKHGGINEGLCESLCGKYRVWRLALGLEKKKQAGRRQKKNLRNSPKNS